MNIINKTIVALAVLAVASAGFAQEKAKDTSNGLLGQRYSDVSFSVGNPHGLSDNSYGGDIKVNLPIHDSFGDDWDLGFHYGKARISTGGVRAESQAFGATVTGYTQWQGVKPFVTAGFGYAHTAVRVAGHKIEDQGAIWGGGIGVEAPMGAFILTPSVSYSKFENQGTYHYGVEASKWFTDIIGGYADVTFSNDNGRGGEVWTYTVGLRFKF